ncbi:hypothetical protein LTR27_004473 [Elasticomyces elasticus]|nr:hypothetical protein LTR27_004473 [Elasticomyces elasticus]
MVPSTVFFFLWLFRWSHVNDLQNASVPITVTLELWAVFAAVLWQEELWSGKIDSGTRVVPTLRKTRLLACTGYGRPTIVPSPYLAVETRELINYRLKHLRDTATTVDLISAAMTISLLLHGLSSASII